MNWLDSKSMQKAFTKLPWLRVGLVILFSLLLVASLFAVWKTATMPEVWEEPITLVNYEHQGTFDYTTYINPTHLFGPPYPEEEEEDEETMSLYFTNIIEDIEVTFTYGFAPDYPSPTRLTSSDVDIVAIIHGPSGWQKEVLLKSDSAQDDYFTIRFPLELDEFDEIINDIEEELGIREEQPRYTYEYEYVEGEGYVVTEVSRREPESNVYDLTIEARVNLATYTGSGWLEDTFTQAMELRIDRSTLEWDKELHLSERRYHEGFTYKHRGDFGYTITLKENSLYGADVETLSPEPYQWPTVIPRPAGEVCFLQITDLVKANFDYRFVCDREVTNLVEEVEVTAILSSPDVWSKTFTLVPKTEKSGDFVLNFPVDVNYFNDMADTIGEEIGVGAGTHELIIQAVVHTRTETGFGDIDEVHTYTLEGELGGTTLTWSEELQKSEPGTIMGTRIITDPNVDGYRLWSRIILVVVVLISVFVMWNAIRTRPVISRVEIEARQARKKYKTMIVDVSKLPVVRVEEVVIRFGSVDELAKAADALLKPVLHQATADKHTYCVIDGLTRYQYVSELSDEESQTEDESSSE